MTEAQPPKRPRLHAFEYLYRDAGNWKTHGLVLLRGTCPPSIHTFIVDALESGMYFVAEQVHIPPLQHRHRIEYGDADANLDHAFHEFVGLRPATAADIRQAELTLPADVTAKFFVRAKQRWNCSLSPYA